MAVTLFLLALLMVGLLVAFAIVLAFLKLLVALVLLPVRLVLKLALLPVKLVLGVLLFPVFFLFVLTGGIAALALCVPLLPFLIVGGAVWLMVRRGHTARAV